MTKHSKMLSIQRLNAARCSTTIPHGDRITGRDWKAAGERETGEETDCQPVTTRRIAAWGSAAVDNNSVNNDNDQMYTTHMHEANQPSVRQPDLPSPVCDQRRRRQRHRYCVEGRSFNRQHGPGFPSNIRPSCPSRPSRAGARSPTAPPTDTVYRWQK